MAALDSAHASLSLSLPTLISPRLSSSDPRERHRGLSHHTQTVLDILLAPIDLPIPEDSQDLFTDLKVTKHRLHPVPVDLETYLASGLPAMTMGRSLSHDPLFFAAPLAAGTHLARVAS
jgi:hypothetical protein